MSYKVYWLFKETDEPFGSGFIYSRGKVGVRTGFPAVSLPALLPLHSSSSLSPQESGGDNWGIILQEGLGESLMLVFPRGTGRHSSLTLPPMVTGGMQMGDRRSCWMWTCRPALETLGARTDVPCDFAGPGGLPAGVGGVSRSLCSKGLWAPSRVWLT